MDFLSEILYKVKYGKKFSPGEPVPDISSSGGYLDILVHPKYTIKCSISRSTTAKSPGQLQTSCFGFCLKMSARYV